MPTWFSRITASSDDAYESDAGSVSTGSSTLRCGNTEPYVGMRFQNVTVPAGATITAATLQVQASNSDTSTVEISIHCRLVSDAATWAGSSDEISDASKSASPVVWSPPSFSSSSNYTTDDLSTIIQSLIDGEGGITWASGNDLAIICQRTDTDGGTHRRRWKSYDQNPSIAPLLSITYEEGEEAGLSLGKDLGLSTINNVVAQGILNISADMGMNVPASALAYSSLSLDEFAAMIEAASTSTPGGQDGAETISRVAQMATVADGDRNGYLVLSGVKSFSAIGEVILAAGLSMDNVRAFSTSNVGFDIIVKLPEERTEYISEEVRTQYIRD